MQMSSQAATPVTPKRIEVADYLAQFRETQGRHLQARGRRYLAEMLDLLAEFLDERGYDVVSSAPRRGERTFSSLLAALDEFERDEVQDAFEGNREQLRVADAALRALNRQLGKL